MLTDEQKKQLRAVAAAEQAQARKQQRAREDYETALTQANYAMLQANREAHFHPKEGEEPAPLIAPDDLRELAIQALAAKGMINPDATGGTPVVPTGETPVLPDANS